ncbi:HEAT repeat domain-containing protein [Streptomyces shenzhenensis]|uniref:HEAT repeat domain-containing protein n=1 Tax=Streptomyces shenzhenensis TaxID=943815 RepID=UPI001F48DFE8|nr:HEAT repeat domain-containing protein [Streptomyces shenzhenensis]
MGWRDELVELLGRAGLELAGDPCVEDVVPPPVAWRHVIRWEARPAVEVALDRPDAVAELNAQWHRLAAEAGLLDGDGVFLVDFQGNPRQGWIRVRLTDGWDLAGVFGGRPGQPEFVTLSRDGDALVGATTEEYTVWLVVVDRIRERQEESARAAAAETEEDRATAWEALFRGPRPMEKLLGSWACGLSLNPALPKDLLPLLLERSHFAMYSAMPADVVDTLLGHPDWKVRKHAAEVQPNITPDQWARVIAAEEDEKHRWILTLLAADRRAELPEDTCRSLAADPSARVRSETARLQGLPADLAVTLSRDPDGGVRTVACVTAWPHLDAAARAALLADPHGTVRERALQLHHRGHPVSRSVYESGGIGGEMLESCRLERALAEHLARHGEADERRSLARNPWLDPGLVALLAEDPDAHVRWSVSVRADLTEEQRAGIPVDFDPVGRYHPLDWVTALHDDPDAMRRLAASTHPLIRRSVARARHLPPDVVARLADDEDRVVQLFLAESCDDAPAEMLLRVWQWWTGSLTVPDRPRGHPNFPRHGLLRYADDPSPRLRRLALDDPESTPDLVERLSRDPSDEVRHRAATDPRLPAVAAARLLADPHEYVRQAAARHPRLPVGLLTQLLRGGGAETAARNPALPVAVMRRMVESLGTVRAHGAHVRA